MMRAGLGPKRLARGKTKHLVLPRPLRGQVGEASNAHAMREPGGSCLLPFKNRHANPWYFDTR